MGRLGQPLTGMDFADRLTTELESTTDSAERKALLYALMRVMETAPEAERDPFEFLDMAISEDPDLPDLVWEEWRAAGRRGAKKRLTALKRLFAVLEDPTERAHCRLQLARLYSTHFGDPRLARKELERAEALAPELREVVWALAESDAALGRTGNITGRLEKLVAHTRDSVFRAALLTEIAEIKLKQNDQIAASGLLNQALKEEGIDWSIVHAVLRLSARIENWELHERALTKLADAAASPPSTPDAERGMGHSFDGFERGNAVVGALYWYLAVVRETRMGSLEKTLEALSNAIAFLPESDFLRNERCRLLAASGALDQALAQAGERSSEVERAVFALMAGSPTAAASLSGAERDASGSLVSEILAEHTDPEGPPPQNGEVPETLLAWLETHVSHPDAAKVAALLRGVGVEYPLIDVVLEEFQSRDKSLIALLREEHAPWAHALNALFGAPEARAEAYLDWSNTTADDSLKATLLFLAAGQAASVGDDARSRELEEQAERLAAESTSGTLAFEPLPENFRKTANALADEAADSNTLDATREALFKRAMIQEHALADPAAAAATLDDLCAISTADAAPLWLSMRLACRAGDWALVANRINRLAPLAARDAALFALCAGEIDLFVTRRYDRAVTAFESIIETENETLRETARLYRSLALRQLDREEDLRTSLERESLPPPEMVGLVPPDVRDANRRMLNSVRTMSFLEGLDENHTRRLLKEMMFGLEGDTPLQGKLYGVSRCLGQLADVSPPGEMTDALRASAALLSGTPVKTDFIQSKDDIISEEALWHLADRLPASEDPFLVEKILSDRLERSESLNDWDRLELILADAEAKERSGNLKGALRRVQDGLNIASSHPGLLEKKASLAVKAENFIEAADTHGRLAGFYRSQAEKAHHLAQAALILYDKLDNPKGARRICEEAIRRVPGHAQANDVLEYIFRSCFDDGEPQGAAGEQRLTLQDAVSRASSDVEGIVEDDQSEIAEGEEVMQLRDRRARALFEGDDQAVWYCDELLSLLDGAAPASPLVSAIPNPRWDPASVSALCEHPRDAMVASEIARLTADIAPPGLEGVYTRPAEAKVAADEEEKFSSLMAWCRSWGAAAGLGEFDIFVLDKADLDVAAFQPEDSTLFLSQHVSHPLSADHKFAIGTLLWRAARGLCAFPKSDIVGPVRWVISVASAVLDVREGLPLPVKPDFVNRASIAILDTVAERLRDPCQRLLQESSIALRVWSEATSFSADRFGLLAVGRVTDTIRIIIAETLGRAGVEALTHGFRETLLRSPRAKELYRFSLSNAYLETRSVRPHPSLLPGGGP